MKKNKAGNFARDSGQACVETMIGRQDGYEEVLTKCARALELPSTQHGDKVVALLSSGGAVIPSSSDWTLGNYMRCLHRGPNSVRFGVGYIKKKVCEVLTYRQYTESDSIYF